MLSKEKRISEKSQLKEWLKYEASLYGNIGIRRLCWFREGTILFRHQKLLRKTEYYMNSNKKLRGMIFKIRLKSMQYKYALHIPINCCGKGLKIMHIGPVLMNGNVTVGENCKFHINTALVAGGTNDDAPVLDDGVVMGVGAVVLGDVNIAKNVAIGANAVVNRDVVEENIAVAGVPARKISNNGRLEWDKRNKSNNNII